MPMAGSWSNGLYLECYALRQRTFRRTIPLRSREIALQLWLFWLIIMEFTSATCFRNKVDVMIGGRYSYLIQDPSPFFWYKKVLTVILLSVTTRLLFPRNSEKMLDYLETKAERDAFIDQYDNFLFDCDGMLYIYIYICMSINLHFVIYPYVRCLVGRYSYVWWRPWSHGIITLKRYSKAKPSFHVVIDRQFDFREACVLC